MNKLPLSFIGAIAISLSASAQPQIYSLAVHYDKKLNQYLDSVINLISMAQEDEGYLATCVTNKSKLREGQSGGVLEWKINYGQTLDDVVQGKKPYFVGYEIR